MYFTFKWDHSSAGRAPALQAGGHRFEPYWSHHFGGVPEWPKGADCKSVSYAFSGSNPLSSTKKTLDNIRKDDIIVLFLIKIPCGCSSVVEPRPSKPVARVRSPSPAPFFCWHLQLNWIEQWPSKPCVRGSSPFRCTIHMLVFYKALYLLKIRGFYF